MKNIFFSQLFLFTVITACGQSPVITSSDIASIGDAFVVTNSNPLIDFDSADTGPDHNWDYSFLETITTDTSIWLNEEDTDPLYFFLWLSSDIAEQMTSDISTDYFTVEDVYNFYTKDDDEFALAGFGGIISGIPFPVSFDDNDILYQFPLTYGDSWSSVSGFDMEIPGVATWSETRERSTHADGWGTLTTPFGEFQTLRLNSVVEISDVIEYGGIEYPFSYTLTEYKWLMNDGGIPVLQINTQNLLGSETITQVICRTGPVTSTVAPSGENATQSSLYHVPGNSEMLLQINSAESVHLSASIVSQYGSSVYAFEHVNSGSNRLTLPEQLAAGLYFLVIQSEGAAIGVHKFIIAGHDN
jgi:hypothetical protein